MGARSANHPGLREALLAATLKLVEENGPDGVSVREVARRAGVSSGAPFRHFADKRALMAAVAEEGCRRLNAELQRAFERWKDNPLEAFREMGLAYVRFATTHPAHFRVMHMPEYADPSASPALAGALEEGSSRMREVVEWGQRAGMIRAGDPARIMLAARAILYGVARMVVDGQLLAEGVPADQVEEIAWDMTQMLGEGIVTDTVREVSRARSEPANSVSGGGA